MKYQQENIETHKMPTIKYFGPTKYPQEKLSGPQRHDGTRSTRPTMARDPQNLAHSIPDM